MINKYIIKVKKITMEGNLLNPIKLLGEWNEGYALDHHTIYSEYIGEDEYGRAQYDTKRSELGQLLYELKYQGKKDNAQKICRIINPFLKKWGLENKIDYIIPAPSSNKRTFQPVDEICKEIGISLNKRFISGFLVKNSRSQSKNLGQEQKKELRGSIERKKRFKRRVSVLVVDDLYQSGETLSECTKVLRNDPNIDNIYILTITKTRR
jgi:competence protein ComFC